MPELKEYETRLELNQQGIASFTTPIITGYLESIRVSQTMPSRIVIASARTEDLIVDGHFRLTENMYPRIRGMHTNSKFVDHYATRHLLNESLQITVRGARQQNCAFILRWVTT